MTNILSRAIAVTREATYIDGRKPVAPPTADVLAEGLSAFLAVVFRLLGGSGVLLLDGHTATALGLPGDVLPDGGTGREHPALNTLRAAGYHAKEVHRWFHVKHRGAQVSIGLLDHLDAAYFPMLAARVSDTTAALATWGRVAGVPWFGSGGDAGNELLRASGTMRADGRIIEPKWWSHTGPKGDPNEYAYDITSWNRPMSGCVKAYGYDRVRAYLAAMTTTEVAGLHLAHSDRAGFDPRRSGWWRCRVAPWQLFHLMPDPAGYGPIESDGTRLLTTPTLRLLDQLGAEDVHGGFEVVESWTAPAQDNILKPYATRLRTIWDQAVEIRDDTERALIRAGVKGAYTQSAGLWCSHRSSVQRRDWSAAATAQSRATVWRAAWKAGWANGNPLVGPWPLWITNDAVYYGGPDDAGKEIEPHGFTLADKLGGWRPLPPRDVSRETGMPIKIREEVNA